VTPGYFRTFGIDRIRGRDFTSADRGGALPVAVVSRSMADLYFGETDPIGRTFQLGGEKQQRTIVGIVEDVRHEQLRVQVAPRMVYTPLEQPSSALDGVTDVPTQLTVAVRAAGDPGAMAATLRAEVRATSKDALVPYVRTMERQIAATLIPEHLLATLSAGFAAVALLLACVGLYGVMSYNVSRRTREIGIRIALGALPRTVLFRVLGETLRLSTAGVALGLVGALALARTLSTFLFGLTSHDPATLLGTTALLLAVALLSGFLPARHAATVDPVRALKNE
jgi:predicted permease